MSDFTHDPSEYIRGLQQLLVSGEKKIGFLFGAGTSLAQKNALSPKVPATDAMTKSLITAISTNGVTKDKNSLTPAKCKIFFDKMEIEVGKDKFNIESILSNLENKYEVIGDNLLNGLCKIEIEVLIQDFKDRIKKEVSVHKKIEENNFTETDLIQTDFAEWINQANRKYPIEIFTTNYDFLFEIGLEYHSVPFYTGFSGAYRPFFSAESVENLSFLPNQTKLWKIHGSLGWSVDKRTKRVIKADSSSDDILIYPSILKYNKSQKQPYTSLMDRLSSFLKQDDSVLFVCGYSFSDEHINERIVSALKTNTTSHVIALVFDKQDEKNYTLSDDSALTKIGLANSKISIYGFRNAVIGCKYGEWCLRKEPGKEDTPNINLYFDEDAPRPKDDAVGEIDKGQKMWTGKGEFVLSDFSKFIKFLRAMMI